MTKFERLLFLLSEYERVCELIGRGHTTAATLGYKSQVKAEILDMFSSVKE